MNFNQYVFFVVVLLIYIIAIPFGFFVKTWEAWREYFTIDIPNLFNIMKKHYKELK